MNNTAETPKLQSNSILETAESYFQRSWQPIPIPFKTKKPVLEAWQNFKTGDKDELSNYFNGKPQNIGVLLGEASSGLIDVDLDSTNAVKLAAYFLPDTNAVFGRKSKQKSHFLYVCPRAKTEKFQFNEMIAEIRGGGCQTVFPESVHISGERITWHADGEPAEVNFDDLRFAVGRLSSACLIADFWKDTKRHELSLALCGSLLRNGFSFEDTQLFIKAVCFAAGDDETDDRTKAVETTFERLRNNQRVVGLPKLKELTSEKAVNLLTKWLNLDTKFQNEAAARETLVIRPTEDDYLQSFRLTEKGLFYVSYEKSKNNSVQENEIFLCSPLRVIATGKDNEGNGKTHVIEFRDDDGRTRQEFIALRDVVQEPLKFLGDLVSFGVILNPQHKQRIIEYLIHSKPEKRLTFVYKTGWHNESFVFPDKVYSATESNLMLTGENTIANKLKVAGTLEDWKENVSKYCAGNSRLMFSVSCAFAAVLLPLSNQLGGGFHLRGASSEGKSTALKVAGSVFGCASKAHGFSETWRATQNGLEIVAENHNHLLLLLDEIKEITSPQDIGKIIYMLSNGKGKMRMTEKIKARKKSEWLLLILSSGELSLSDLVSETKERVFGGQEARFIDVQASVENGFGIYENLHGFTNGAEFSAHLNQASTTYYGAAIREFIQKVVENLESVRGQIKETEEKFLKKNVDPTASGEVSRVAEKFALVAYAGWLASKLGVTGWNADEAAATAERIFKEWIDQRGTLSGFDVSEGCRKILSLIDKRSNSDFQDLDNLDYSRPQNRAGYKRKAESGETEFLFTSKQFAELCKGYNQKKILDELKRLGHLKTYNSGQSNQLKITLPDLSKQQNERLYVYVLTIENSPPES